MGPWTYVRSSGHSRMLSATMPQARCFAALLALSACWAAGNCRAQEMEPRSYSPAPSGVNFLVLVAGNSEGGVLTDPSLPVTDIEAEIKALAFGYGRTFGDRKSVV